MEPAILPSQKIEELITKLQTNTELASKLGVKTIVPYKEALKFKAHNRL